MAKNTKKQPKINRHPQTQEFEDESLEKNTSNEEEKQKVDDLPEETSEDVKDFLAGETDELPADTEIISEEDAKKLEEKALEDLDKDLNETSDDNQNNTEESSTSTEKTYEPKENSDDENLKPVPEIVANTKEEKRLLEQKKAHTNEIQELEEKNSVLEREAEKFDNLASTMDSEPFVELKSLVKEAIKTYVDSDDIKEMKKKTKNFDAICQMQELLTEYKNLANENRQNITANNNEIESLKNKIEEIDTKLHNFQQKLDLEQ